MLQIFPPRVELLFPTKVRLYPHSYRDSCFPPKCSSIHTHTGVSLLIGRTQTTSASHWSISLACTPDVLEPPSCCCRTNFTALNLFFSFVWWPPSVKLLQGHHCAFLRHWRNLQQILSSTTSFMPLRSMEYPAKACAVREGCWYWYILTTQEFFKKRNW